MSRRIVSVGYDQVSLTLRNWVLERAGYQVIAASSKEDALLALKQEGCDLFIIAGVIPTADIRELVVALSGNAPMLWLFDGAREELPGISAYMPLLDGPEELLDRVGQLLAKPKPVAAADWRLLAKQPHHSKRQ